MPLANAYTIYDLVVCHHLCSFVIIKLHLSFPFLQHDVLIIPKSTKPTHIKENTNLFDFELSAEDLETLEEMNEGVHFCWNPDVIH